MQFGTKRHENRLWWRRVAAPAACLALVAIACGSAVPDTVRAAANNPAPTVDPTLPSSTTTSTSSTPPITTTTTFVPPTTRETLPPQPVQTGTTVLPDLSLVATADTGADQHTVNLEWTGGTRVDVYRDAGLIALIGSGTTFTDIIGLSGEAAYVYRVCHAGTVTCSADVTVEF